jgi:hypothetical protein
MLIILYVALGVILGGLVLRWMSPANVAKRREQRLVRQLSRFVSQEAEKQKRMSPSDRAAYLESLGNDSK